MGATAWPRETLADAWPRTLAERFRIVAIKDRAVVTLASTADPEGIGLALYTLHCEGQLEDWPIGVLDTHGDSTVSGDWIVSPWRCTHNHRREP